MKTLEKNSGIGLKKAKFFLYRSLTYSSFLLIPVYVQKSLDLNPFLLSLFMSLYIIFVFSQWFFLGKEIDHRFKIYFRVNSSLDRIIYRIILGMSAFIIYFNFLSLLSPKWINNSFWITWAVLGLFYSWPTRGKIIQESMSSNFNEFKYLDRFEKTILFFVGALLVVTIPEPTQLTNIGALKLFFDPAETISPLLWNFFEVNYYPFIKYPELFKIAWSMNFYSCFALFLFTFYSLLRYFVSRRLSILGVFGLISSWSVTKTLASDYGLALESTFTLLWVWSLMWATKSSTYRAGLFLGLINFIGVLINPVNIFLSVFQFASLYFLFLEDKTHWYRRQMMRYALFGFILSILVFLQHPIGISPLLDFGVDFGPYFKLVDRKAFFALSFLGALLLILKKFAANKVKVIRDFKIDGTKLYELFLSISVVSLTALLFETPNMKAFSLMWLICFLSVLPLEFLFQSISRLRSSRNMIYLVYILICLLDSHFEGRVKIILRIINS